MITNNEYRRKKIRKKLTKTKKTKTNYDDDLYADHAKFPLNHC